ncbi:MAG: hypothetical protein AAGB04_24205 [Pseudomonadota bacterium]
MKTIWVAALLTIMFGHSARAEEAKRVGSIIGFDKAQSFACKQKSNYKVVAWAREQLKSMTEDQAQIANKMSQKTYRDMTKSLGKLLTYQEGSFQANMVKFLCRTIDSVLTKAEKKHLSQQ